MLPAGQGFKSQDHRILHPDQHASAIEASGREAQNFVAVHGHSDTKHPDQFSSPATFQKALDMSEWFRVNLDIGHFFAAGFDPVAYITEHHARVTHIHVKDRKKDDGPNEPFGEGDTPIKPVLQLLKQKKYPIPALVEYEYHGTGT